MTCFPSTLVTFPISRPRQNQRMPCAISSSGPRKIIIVIHLLHNRAGRFSQPDATTIIRKVPRPWTQNSRGSKFTLHITRHPCQNQKSQSWHQSLIWKNIICLAAQPPPRNILRPRLRVKQFDKLKFTSIRVLGGMIKNFGNCNSTTSRGRAQRFVSQFLPRRELRNIDNDTSRI